MIHFYFSVYGFFFFHLILARFNQCMRFTHIYKCFFFSMCWLDNCIDRKERQWAPTSRPLFSLSPFTQCTRTFYMKINYHFNTSFDYNTRKYHENWLSLIKLRLEISYCFVDYNSMGCTIQCYIYCQHTTNLLDTFHLAHWILMHTLNRMENTRKLFWFDSLVWTFVHIQNCLKLKRHTHCSVSLFQCVLLNFVWDFCCYCCWMREFVFSLRFTVWIVLCGIILFAVSYFQNDDISILNAQIFFYDVSSKRRN